MHRTNLTSQKKTLLSALLAVLALAALSALSASSFENDPDDGVEPASIATASPVESRGARDVNLARASTY